MSFSKYQRAMKGSRRHEFPAARDNALALRFGIGPVQCPGVGIFDIEGNPPAGLEVVRDLDKAELDHEQNFRVGHVRDHAGPGVQRAQKGAHEHQRSGSETGAPKSLAPRGRTLCRASSCPPPCDVAAPPICCAALTGPKNFRLKST